MRYLFLRAKMRAANVSLATQTMCQAFVTCTRHVACQCHRERRSGGGRDREEAESGA